MPGSLKKYVETVFDPTSNAEKKMEVRHAAEELRGFWKCVQTQSRYVRYITARYNGLLFSPISKTKSSVFFYSPMCPGFDSRTLRHIWVEFVVSSLLCSERFSSGYPGFPLSSKTNISNSNSSLESVPN